jgi:hypothetical protein
MKAKQIGVRLEDGTKAALERAAAQDLRSVSQLVEKIVTEWLVQKNYVLRAHEEYGEREVDRRLAEYKLEMQRSNYK